MINTNAFKGTSNNSQFGTPAHAGVQLCRELMDSCFRRNDIFRGSLNTLTRSPLTLPSPRWGEGWGEGQFNEM